MNYSKKRRRLFKNKDGKGYLYSTKKSRLDIFEKKLSVLILIIFVCIIIYVAVIATVKNVTSQDDLEDRYISLTTAETGTKDVYGAQKDASGNVTSINDIVPISCYGDSFTNAADDATVSYPGVLSVYAQRTVYNLAVDSDTIFEMAAREGGVSAVVSPFIIPVSKTPTEVVLTNEDGKALNFDFSKNGGFNPCTIQGVEGLLSIIDGKYSFTRADSGDETLVLTPTEVETRAMSLRTDDICVFFLGDDDIYNTPEEAIEIYNRMIEYLGDNSSYLIVGPVKGEVAELDAANSALAEAFGDKFLDLRTYLITQADEDINITLSEDDSILADNGIVPYIYFADNDSLSAQGADAVGKAVYDKLNSLGYFADAQSEAK